MVSLAPDYQLTFGEMMAMADFFESLSQMRELAAVNRQGPGSREEIEYIRTVKVRGRKESADSFSEKAIEAANRRYYQLALDNRSHFANPKTSDQNLSVKDKSRGVHEDLRLQWANMIPRFVSKLTIPHAGAGYRYYHMEAMLEAYLAGLVRDDLGKAMAYEAFGAHYLTDAFAGGHLRTPRVSIKDHWDPIVPMFTYNLKGFIAQALALRIGDTESLVSREMAYHGALGRKGTLTQVSAIIDEKAPLTFGDVVGGAIHEYDCARGVVAEVEGERETLMGDNKLGGRTEELASQAVNLSHNDIIRAWAIGQRSGGIEEVMASATAGKLVGAERMLPTVVPDSELAPAQRSVKWDFPSVDDLLDHRPFREAVAEFGRRQASELAELEESDALPEIAKPHFRPAIVKPFERDALHTLRRVIHWTPDTGGGMFGHNQDDNALDYYNEAKRRHAVTTLALDQRISLIRKLLDGPTATDEENAVFDMLTANPAHSGAVIAAIGWDRLEDEIGDRFVKQFPEYHHR